MMAAINGLLARLNRVFDKDPQPEMLRVRRSGAPLRWEVAGGWLRLGTGPDAWDIEVELDPLAPDGSGRTRFQAGLEPVTINTVASAISGQTGYTLENNLAPELTRRAAVCLLEGGGQAGPGIPISLRVWTAPLWGVMDAYASEILLLRETCAAAPAQMVLSSAEDEWLDMLGGFYKVPRRAGEGDRAYGARIGVEALHSHGNNVAIEVVLEARFGRSVSVDDTVVYGPAIPIYDGAYLNDGSQVHNAQPAVFFGAFNVTLPYDPASDGTEAAFRAAVRAAAAPLASGGIRIVDIILT